MDTGKKFRKGVNNGLVYMIRSYQKWVSPMMVPRCRFVPSCSEYALQALQTHGALRASGLIVKRLLRCQPLCAGGYDPVPSRQEHCQDHNG